ncbi:MAG: acyl-[ACP]--phospholipid O-acyltransferase, partial [Janthinobacterium lividum]
GSTPLLFAVLFGLGVQATFFSPLKNAILPSHLAAAELVAGNGLVEAGTFLGILAGTLAGSALIGLEHGAWLVSGTGIACALAGIASAALVPPAPSSARDLRIGWNVAAETAGLLRMARANRPVWLCILGLSWFWTLGATLLAVLPSLVRDDLGATETVFTLMLGFFSVGVALGSVTCSRLLRGQVSARLVPVAALGLSLFLWDFTRAVGHAAGEAGSLTGIGALLHGLTGWRMMIDLLLLAACGGIYSVPLYAIMQERSEAARLARMVAANNVLNAVAITAAAVLTAGLAMLGAAPVTVLLAMAAANLAVAGWIMRLLPQQTVRALFRWYFIRLHRAEISGLENLPPRATRAVIVVNHQSFLDGCFVAAFLPHAPTFAVNVQIARQWWARPFLAAVRHFTVDPANPFSTKTMVRAVQGGETLVVFPEGRITMTGALMKVYDGAGMVADKAAALVVPVRIDGLRDTRFSRLGRRGPRRWFPRLSLTVLPPVSLAAPGQGPHAIDPALRGRARRRAIGALLQDVMERAAFAAAPTGRTLWTAFLDAASRFGAATPIIEDIARAPMRYGRLTLAATVLGRHLSRELPASPPVGVLLPNANGTVVTLLALQAFGRVPAMLNVSAGAEGMLAACAAAQVTTVLSSRAFVERGRLQATVARMAGAVRFIWLEDVRAGLGRRETLRGWWLSRRARTLPGATLSPDAAAVVLFTSGSEGAPKGVVLSHRNLVANIAQVAAVIDFNAADRVFNAMPMFHSFGLTGGTLLPLLSGVRTFHYPSPLHYRIVPELIYDTDSTIAFGTDTFLTGWARYAHPYDFYAMRTIISGAEKVRDETRRLYAERFGVRLLEGYGATETAPVLALNTPMHGRTGSAGRLLPGIEHRLDPVAGIPEGGRLVVRGPNVMLGYLRHTAPGVLEPPEDGWYDTGDICTVDPQGFVHLLGRAKRFAKIAGEMVSMPAAEALATALWPDALHAVVAVADARKGEALVLLTTQPGADAAALSAAARARGAAEIGVPRRIQLVQALPMLGTGKVDYVAATALAAG